ncbi:MAG: hypothetical protein IPG08_18015 [Sphingobacteriaceae bacterium]|nr:hypothetical protein [Sphingobacteriaceae bacterium]
MNETKYYFRDPWLSIALQPLSAQTDSTKKKSKLFELSFGQSVLFVPNSQLDSIRKNSSIIVPTMLFYF